MSKIEQICVDGCAGVADVPNEVAHYLLHTEKGVPIRRIARAKGCHASTIHRQIRKIEARREDALVDGGLSALSRCSAAQLQSNTATSNMGRNMQAPTSELGTADFEREARRLLRRLSEPDACLAFAADMEKAVVVRETGDGRTIRTAVTAREVAQAMAVRDWLVCAAPGRVSRYRITTAGRAALKRFLAAQSEAEHGGGFAEQHREWDSRNIKIPGSTRTARTRFNAAESPISLLSRRKGNDGEPFLSTEMVSAAERLREDFELSQMGPKIGQNWEKFLTGGSPGQASGDAPIGRGSDAARGRVAAAVGALGSGLGDVALRVCCFLEGVETAEKRLGWSARSGKVVLRIALQRLHQHYKAQGASGLIG